MSRYALSSWRDSSGLPVDSIPSLAQTPDGYLWVGTEHGLVRFDGVRFKTFTKANTPEFRTNEISALLVSTAGTLWIGTRRGGILTFDGSRFRRLPIKYRYISAFAESPDGSVWIGAHTAIIRFRDGVSTAFGKEQGYPGGFLTDLAADANGVYAALPEGVIRIATDGRLSRMDGLGSAVPLSLLMTRRGLLAGDREGNVHRLVRGRFEPYLRTGSRHAIMSIHEGARDSLWLATVGGGLVRFAGGRMERLTAHEGLTSDSLNDLLEDGEGSLWAGTTGGGLVQLKAPRLTTVEMRQLTAEWILPMTQARDGSVWFGTNGGGVNRLSGDSHVRLGPVIGVYPEILSAIAEDFDGSIWLGSSRGLQRVRDGRVVQNVSAADGLEGKYVFSVTASRMGGVWVTTEEGLYRVTAGGKARRLTEKDGLKPGLILSIREASDGSLWLARPMRVEHLSNGRLVAYGREQGLSSRTVTSLTLDEIDGSTWVATIGEGLFRIRNGRVTQYTEANGLLTDSVYGVVEDRAGNLWIPTGRGLFSVRRSELDAFDSNPGKRLAINVFRKEDGLKTSDFSGGFDRPGFRAANGTLWFPTTRGLVVVDPNRIRSNFSAPRVIIEDIVANGVQYTSSSPRVPAPSEHRALEFSYTAPWFYSPDKLKFEYMLEGFDDGWRKAGSRRTAYYTNVPPGRYRFLVRVTTGEGSTAGASTQLELEPHYYETWRFRIAMALLLVLLAMIFHRRQVESLQRHQAELEKSEDHFRSLIENASDMIVEIGVDGRVAYASPSVQRILGLRPFDINGRELGFLLNDYDSGENLLGAIRRDGRHSAALAFREASGSVREVEVFGALAQGGQNIVLNCRDVTERRKLEAQLAQANRLSSLGRLAATVSHEFNNVLMGIQPFVDLIRRKSEQAPVQNAAAQIAGTVGRGKRITDQILRYTRAVDPTLASVPLKDWFANMSAELRALTGPGVRVSALAPRGLHVSADVSQLTQVFTNLAINARDAGAQDFVIEAGLIESDGRFRYGIVSDPGKFAHISVADNGSGIAPSVLPHVFEPLFTTKTTRGTGLGLAVAQQVVSRHGGEIFVESQVGKGTTFHIFLPLAEAKEEAKPEMAAQQAPAMPSCRLLLVEDDPIIAEGILTLLEDEGFTAAVAPTGTEALASIPTFHPDIVVLDVGLPDIDGIEVYRRLRGRWPSLPVIFSTGHGDTASLQDIPPPHPPFLVKPYDVSVLSEAVAALLHADRSVA